MSAELPIQSNAEKREKLPSWEKIQEHLNPEQRTAAKLSFTKNVLQGAFRSAFAEISELQEQGVTDLHSLDKLSNERDRAKVMVHISNFMKASDAIEKGGEARATIETGEDPVFQDQGSAFIARVESVYPERNQIYMDALDWKPKDIVREANKAYAYVTNVPKFFAEYMYKETGLEPETFKQKLKRWRPSVLNTALTFAASEGLPTLGSAAAVKFHPLQDTSFLKDLATMGESYALWGGAIGMAGYESVLLLDETGIGTNVFAKSAYDKFPDNRKRQIWETIKGLVTPDGYAEAYYYLTAILAGTITKDFSTFAEVIAGANVIAGLEKSGLAGLLRSRRKDGPVWHGVEKTGEQLKKVGQKVKPWFRKGEHRA